jgi:hypothetical protein
MSAQRPRARTLRQVIVTWLALLLLGCAVFAHDHHRAPGPGHEQTCSACVMGQAAGVAPTIITFDTAPRVVFVAPPLPAVPVPPRACVLVTAPKTDPPRA